MKKWMALGLALLLNVQHGMVLSKDLESRPKTPPPVENAPAPVSSPFFPVALTTMERNGDHIRLTFNASPGLHFCVYRGTMNGLVIQGLLGGRAHEKDRSHCTFADQDGVASDVFKIRGTGLLLVNVITVDQRAHVTAIPIGPFKPAP